MIEVTYRTRILRQHLSPDGVPCFKPKAIGVWYEYTAIFWNAATMKSKFKEWNSLTREYKILMALPYHPAKDGTRFIHGRG